MQQDIDVVPGGRKRVHGVFVDKDGSVSIGDSEANRIRVLRRR